jgi:hypothetical protein
MLVFASEAIHCSVRQGEDVGFSSDSTRCCGSSWTRLGISLDSSCCLYLILKSHLLS